MHAINITVCMFREVSSRAYFSIFPKLGNVAGIEINLVVKTIATFVWLFTTFSTVNFRNCLSTLFVTLSPIVRLLLQWWQHQHILHRSKCRNCVFCSGLFFLQNATLMAEKCIRHHYTQTIGLDAWRKTLGRSKDRHNLIKLVKWYITL